MRSVSMLSTALCLAALCPLAANAASVTFNFNNTTTYPVGSYLQPSQVLTPDVGSGQTATVGVLNAINPNLVFNVVNSTLGGFAPKNTTVDTGQNIAEVEGSTEIFQLTFGHAIHTISLNFAVVPGAATPTTVNSDPLQLSAFLNAGSATPIATALGVGDAYNSTRTDEYFGSLTLSSVVGFSTIDLNLLNGAAFTGDTYSFDNITADDAITSVPEPGAIALGLALGLPAMWRLRKGRKARSK